MIKQTKFKSYNNITNEEALIAVIEKSGQEKRRLRRKNSRKKSVNKFG